MVHSKLNAFPEMGNLVVHSCLSGFIVNLNKIDIINIQKTSHL